MSYNSFVTNPPRRLYKYVSAERGLQILRDRTIRFTPPRTLNDPFEFCPSLNLSRLKSAYLSLHDQHAKKASGVDRRELMHGFKQFCLGVVHQLSRTISSTGLLSLSESADVPLMWSHYAEDHTGFVIGLDAKEMLGEVYDVDAEGIYGIGPVSYRTVRAEYPDDRGERFEYMFVKDTCWAYEREWRVLRGLKSLKAVSEKVHVAEIPVNAFRCVISGALTSMRHKHEMAELLRSDDYNQVDHFAAGLSASGFALDITTSIGQGLDNDDLVMESYDNPDVFDLYRYTSKGELFKAMEILDPNTEFQLEKHSHGF